MKSISFYSSIIFAYLFPLFTITNEINQNPYEITETGNFIAPSNDNPCNALPLSAGSKSSTTVGATTTNTPPANTMCGSKPVQDVWFKARLSSTGAISIRSELPRSSNTKGMNLSVYAGTSCSNLSFTQVCSDGNEVTFSGQPNQEIYIRAWTPSSTSGSAFIIHLKDIPAPAIADTLLAGGPRVFSPAVPISFNNEPCDARELEPEPTCNNFSSSTIDATQTRVPPAISICGSIPSNDVWFKTRIPFSGIVTITAVPTTSAMTVATMAVYTGDCTSLAFSGICTKELNLVVSGAPNTTFFIRIWGNTRSGGPFNICAKNSGTPGVRPLPLPTGIPQPKNDEPCNAIQISVLRDCGPVQRTTIEATTTTNPVATDICGSEPNRDVWFKAIVPTTGVMTIRTVTTTSLMIGATMAIYTGTCSGLSFTGFCTSDQELVVNGIPGTMVFIRVWGNSETGGPFTICAKNRATSGATECNLSH